MSKAQAPSDAEFFAFGSHHKIGRNNNLYRWNGREWVRSVSTIKAVLNEHNEINNIDKSTAKKQLITLIKNHFEAVKSIDNTADHFGVNRYTVKKYLSL